MFSLSSDLQWVKTHLILVALVAGFAYGGIYLVESKIANHDKQMAAIYQAQNTQFQAQIKEEIATLTAQNAALAQALNQRQSVEVKIPTANGSITATQAAQAISSATKANPGEVTAVGDNVQMDLPVARNVTTSLQLLPLVQQDKADLQKSLDNETKMYTDEVAAHKKDNETNAATVKALKADFRKSKLKWFGIGVVVGFLGRGFAGF